jgi:hypothetical protein
MEKGAIGWEGVENSQGGKAANRPVVNRFFYLPTIGLSGQYILCPGFSATKMLVKCLMPWNHWRFRVGRNMVALFSRVFMGWP